MSKDAEGLMWSQQELQGRIGSAVDNLKKMGAKNITAGAVEARLKLIDNYWAKFEVNHDELRTSHRKSLTDHAYFKSDFFGQVEDSYVTQRAALTDWLTTLKSKNEPSLETSRSSTGEGHSRRSLPRIQLPTFSGKYEEWPAFKDLFHSIIGQEASLSEVERLHYLKTCLKGESEQLIKNLSTTAENFDRAWNMLVEHYENKRLLVRSCFAILTALPKLKEESVSGLRKLLHCTLQTLGSLESIGRPITNCSDLFVHLIVDMLDPTTRRKWENDISGTTEPPSVEELKTFISCRLKTLEALQPGNASTSQAKSGGVNSRSARTHLAQKPAGARCSLCEKEHYILGCNDFQKKTPAQRKQLAEERNLCFNCFGKHPLRACPSKKSCAVCKERHHTSIHDVCQTKCTEDSTPSPPAATTSLHVQRRSEDRVTVLLATARVLVEDRYGVCVPARALVDPGSEVSLVTESLAQRLHLQRSFATTTIFGVGGSKTGVTKGRVALSISSHISSVPLRVTALILPRITVYGGRIGMVDPTWSHLSDLQLADPDYRSADPIDILLGADVYAAILEEGVRKGEPYTPVAQRTTFGWILTGAIAGTSPHGPTLAHQCSIGKDLDALVRRFWEQEEPPHVPAPLTAAEQQCEDHFLRTHSRTSDGRYMVRLPVMTSLPSLQHSLIPAERTLRSMERRFTRDAELQSLYTDFLAEYEALQHMTLVPDKELRQERVCYLPHHGVLKKTAAETKIRVVFNGSARLSSGDCLNDHFLVGPNLLPTLDSVLTRWRHHRVVLVADIAKMYRQVLVHPEDRDLQRILWRADGTDSVKEYRLNTVTYGLACAPFLAMRSLRQLADDEEHLFQASSRTLRRDVYVDDILTGAESVEEAQVVRMQLTELCARGGFPLRKFAASDERILEGVAEEHRQGTREWKPEEGHSMLGILWHPQGDAFSIKVKQPSEETITKRVVLSETARLFDPLGWLAPVVVRAKILIQTLWLQKREWDQPLRTDDQHNWQLFRRELPCLERIRVPRWLGDVTCSRKLEIHGFADASERAMGAVVYLRAIVNGSESRVSLLQAKTRVAPLRQVSLPRLELCAATLLVKLTEHVKATLDLPNSEIFLWSDSTVTLAWISSHPSRWKTYVANRVAEIQRTLPEAIWLHLPGTENPADCASRGLSPEELRRHPLWWTGPPWLQTGEDARTRSTDNETAEADLPERRVTAHTTKAQVEEDAILLRFSRLPRLLHVTAWCMRWLGCLRARRETREQAR